MTLVEIMIVLTIMAGIMAFAAYNVMGALKNAKIKDAGIEVGLISGQIGTYLATHDGHLPQELNDLEETVDGYAPITNRVPNDPWDNPYEYTAKRDGTFELFSAGPDGATGTDDDIYIEGGGPDY
jgi:general secretion pathway protein G